MTRLNDQNEILNDTDKKTCIQTTINQIRKMFGNGSIMFLGDGNTQAVEVVSTGSIDIDQALGIGGLPKGRIVEIYGNEGSGKTTIALQIIANSQKKGGICAFIDAEHALDIKYAENLGVNVPELLLSQPEYGEQAMEIVDTLIRSGSIDVIVVDSVAALVTKSEIEGNMGDAVMASQARLMSQALRKITANTSKYKTLVIFINQVREKIGVMFGSPETTSGGKALKFYSSVRMEIKRRSAIKKGEDVLGYEMEVKIVKNKFHPPFKIAQCEVLYGKGINEVPSVLNNAVKHNIIQKSGNWYNYNDQRLGNGKDAVLQYFHDNQEFYNNIKSQLLVKLAEISK